MSAMELVTIGVLDLQGGVREHMDMLTSLPGVKASAVRTKQELDQVEALILPGGESSAMGRLLALAGLLEPLRARIVQGMPAWGSCAGMILLAKELENDHRRHLALMDIRVTRNAYGSQQESFMATAHIEGIPGEDFPLVFIRAPRVEAAGDGVQVLASYKGAAVACRQGTMVATAFHPELSGDTRFHAWFAALVRQRVTL